MSRIKKYRIDHLSFEFSDYLWYDLVNVQEGYPEFVDMFDRNGEIGEEYQDSWNVDVYYLEHENIRITDAVTLQRFLLNYALVPNEIDEVVDDFLYTKFVNNSDHIHFQFSGDGGGLGFILDVFDNKELEGDPIDSLQVWLDEYKEFM